MKKILTLDDLVNFCKKEKFYNFDSKNTGYQLAVQIPSTFEIAGDYKDNTLMFCNVKLFHIGPNRNRSSVTEDAAKKSLSTIAYKPLLANFCEIDGVKDFTSHDIALDENGNTEYIEKQIGCFTADVPKIEHDKETDKDFVFARVAIPREYTDACAVIERKNGTKVSVELLVNEMQYSVEDDILELTDIVVSGATCLGKNPETGENIEEGMEGARLDIVDFSNKNNSIVNTFSADCQAKLIETLEKLNNTLSTFTIDSKQKDKEVFSDMNHFDELLAKYKVTAEECNFDHENMTDEELDAKFEEIFGEHAEEGNGAEDNQDSTENEFSDENSESNDEPSQEPESENHDEEFALINFRISHDDIRFGIQNLLAAMNDDVHYYVVNAVYDNYFYYEDWVDGSAFKQSYKMRKDTISFNGDPVPVFREFVTQEEKDELENMRKNYALLKEFKDQYDAAQAKAERDAILESAEYAEVKDSDEFKALVTDAEKFSAEEIRTKADLIFAAAMKKKFSFEANKLEKKSSVGINFNVKPSKKNTAYAGLFDN